MSFDPSRYGSMVAELLALDGGGTRLMPLCRGTCSCAEAARRLRQPGIAESLSGARRANEAIAGLWIYFSCLDECHHVAQSANSPEAAFWHGIMHRQEPDAWNAKYWFRQLGTHPIYPALRQEAVSIVELSSVSLQVPSPWDAAWFVDLCDEAGSQDSHPFRPAALEIQRAEWQLLFDYCASRPEPSQ